MFNRFQKVPAIRIFLDTLVEKAFHENSFRLKKIAKESVKQLLKDYPTALTLTDITISYKQRWIEGSLLHIAIHLKCINFIEALLKNNANLNLKNQSGDTPLHYLTNQIHPSLTRDIVLLINNYPKDINVVNKYDCTPFGLIKYQRKKPFILLSSLLPTFLNNHDLDTISFLDFSSFKQLEKESGFLKKVDFIPLFQRLQDNNIKSILIYLILTQRKGPNDLTAMEAILNSFELYIEMIKKKDHEFYQNEWHIIFEFIAQSFHQISEEISKEKSMTDNERKDFSSKIFAFLIAHFFNIIMDGNWVTKHFLTIFNNLWKKYFAPGLEKIAPTFILQNGFIECSLDNYILCFENIKPARSYLQFFNTLPEDLRKNFPEENHFVNVESLDVVIDSLKKGKASGAQIEKATAIYKIQDFISIQEQKHALIELLIKFINLKDIGPIILKRLIEEHPNVLTEIMHLPNSYSSFIAKQVVPILQITQSSDELKNSAKFQLAILRKTKPNQYAKAVTKIFYAYLKTHWKRKGLNIIDPSTKNPVPISLLPIDVYAIIFSYYYQENNLNYSLKLLRRSVPTLYKTCILPLDNTILEENQWKPLYKDNFGYLNKFYENFINNTILLDFYTTTFNVDGILTYCIDKISSFKKYFIPFFYYYLETHGIFISKEELHHLEKYIPIIPKFHDFWILKNGLKEKNYLYEELKKDCPSLTILSGKKQKKEPISEEELLNLKLKLEKAVERMELGINEFYADENQGVRFEDKEETNSIMEMAPDLQKTTQLTNPNKANSTKSDSAPKFKLLQFLEKRVDTTQTSTQSGHPEPKPESKIRKL